MISNRLIPDYDLQLTDADVLFNGVSIFPAPFRNYQLKLFRQVIDGDVKKAYYMLPRRSGKDFTFFRILVYYCLRTANTNAVYLFPDLQMARKIIWEGVFICENVNSRYIEFLPKQICRINNVNMRVKFPNGSSIQLMGTLDASKLRGITSTIIVASEYAFMNPYVLPIISPIISASDGVLLLNSTPNGLNLAYHQHRTFGKTKSWLTVLETAETLLDDDGNRYITEEIIQESIENGMSVSLIRQEYYCECVPDESKVIYAREMNAMQIVKNAYVARTEVHFAFDLGLRDFTSIVAFQIMPTGMPSVVWCFQDNGQPWQHYYNVIESKMVNKRMGKFILPHDGAKRNGSSVTLDTIIDDFKNMGATVMPLKRPKSMDGFIALTRSYMGGMVIDETCEELITALNQYQKDDNHKPIHDEYSHYASAFGYMCMALYNGIDIQNNHEVIRYGI